MSGNLGKIAVALSVYRNDRLDMLEYSINSILNQSYTEFDLFIEVDGKVDEKITKYLTGISLLNNVFVRFNEVNLGLATRLNSIIDIVFSKGGYDYLARMDADDVCDKDRFKTQVEYLISNPNVSLVGSDVEEINDKGDVLFYKEMPSSHEVLLKNIIKRCPLNHPTVMFNLSHFSVRDISYKSELKNTQDYYLWVDLFAKGKVFANINKPLLKFRIDDDFHNRRGFDKAINDVNSRFYAFKVLGNINCSNLLHVFFLFLLRVAPPFLKKIIYSKAR